jgi:hypothetical protein
MQLESGVVPAGAVPNTVVMTVMRATFHAARFWLNATAPLNALSAFATLATFQLPMFALKADAPLKMLSKLETDATFHSLPARVCSSHTCVCVCVCVCV